MTLNTGFIRLLLAACTAALPARGHAAPAATAFPPPRAERASPAYATMEALVSDAVAKLGSRDTSALRGMTFGREEFLRVYPTFASDTGASQRAFACDFFLADNDKTLLRLLEGSGGRPLALSRLEVQGPVEERKGFLLCRGLRLWVVNGESEIPLRFLKSVAKTPSGWKIWSFADD